jgi:hypothetical protein
VSHDSARGDHTAATDRYTCDDRGTGADPTIVLDRDDVSRLALLANRTIDVTCDVIFGEDSHGRSHDDVVANPDSALSAEE